MYRIQKLQKKRAVKEEARLAKQHCEKRRDEEKRLQESHDKRRMEVQRRHDEHQHLLAVANYIDDQDVEVN